MHKIVFDIDEVINDWIGHFLHYIKNNAHLIKGKCDPAILDAHPDDATCWSFFERNWGLQRSDFMHIYNKYCDDGEFSRCWLVDKRIPYDLQGAIDQYKYEGTPEFIYCTSRPPRCIESTVECFERNGIPWNKIYHCSGYLGSKFSKTAVARKGTKKIIYSERPKLINKASVYRWESPDAAFDDKPEYLLEAHGAGVENCWLVNQPHNKQWRQDHWIDFAEINFTSTGWDGTMLGVMRVLRQDNRILKWGGE